VLLSFLQWLESTPWSIRLLESLYVWPLLETTHVLSLGLFVGTALMMDLRLLGLAFRGIPASEFTTRMLPWTRVGFAILVVTGLLLFYSSPVRYYHNIFFRIKTILLILAGLNVWFFHSRVHTRIMEWGHEAVPPRAARFAAAFSIFAWAGVVVTGRMIAYNWFDCDMQPQPEFINWAASCVIPSP
jgi:hypothetical protein